jgi:hypothetical protein
MVIRCGLLATRPDRPTWRGERIVLYCRSDGYATRMNDFRSPVWFSYPSWQSHVHLFPSSCSSMVNILRGTPGNSPVFGFPSDCSELLRTSILRFRTQLVCSKNDLDSDFTLVLRRVKCRLGLRTAWNTCTALVTWCQFSISIRKSISLTNSPTSLSVPSGQNGKLSRVL